MATPKKVAFIGLGVMGFPMARHLAQAGHVVSVYNRTTSKSDAWLQENQGTSAATPRRAVDGAEIAFLCVGNDDDVRSVVLGDEGVLAGMAPDTLIVDHTTASAKLANELSELCGKHEVGFLDAPISGGQAGAENGTLTVMCGGQQRWFALAEPVISAYSQACNLIGPSGSGQLTKMVNQICIAGLLQGLSEALEFGKRSGLNLELVLETISKGAAGSWQMENRGSTMIRDEFDFGFAVDWMRKDLGIVIEEADRLRTAVDITRLVDSYYEEIQREGGGRWDTSSLITRLAAEPS
ncbi:MAG: NAD(P)-dependent oxidoreductase [Acidimicrobiales bacterium]|nr:NAD(P)-dependent oxidoreductase [Acidimicrobiales bacterium]